MRDRRSVTLVAAGVIAVTAICWLWIVPMALDMYGAMTGPSAWMMTSEWDASHTVLLWCMWAVMMAAMMLPSAMPVLLLYGTVVRRSNDAPKAALHVYAMMAGYLLVWALFSVAATFVQRILSERLVLNPMMELASPSAAAVVLLIAGVYQLTPFKWACLRTCRSPLSFVTRAWHAGLSGAVRMGVEHGIFCLGCCWALMLLLFAGGVMNLWVIAALTLVVMIERLAPFGRQISRVTGIVLIAVALGLVTLN